MNQILQEIYERVGEIPGAEKQKLKKAQVLDESLMDELPSDDAGEENEKI